VGLWRLGAAELAAGIGSRRASSREAVVETVERIASCNPKVNALTEVHAEEALAAADRADRQLARGEDVGPLHGVPISVKGNVDVKGWPTTHGVGALADAYPLEDALHIALLRQAGAIVLARSNLPDFASRWHTDNELHGPTVNPRRADLTPGGSSGGEAVAVATGMSALGFGNDDGGSLRYPAQCNAVASLKPGLGCVPDPDLSGDGGRTIGHQLLNVQGPIARRVADLRLALEVIGRENASDPWSSPVRERRTDPTPLRVALLIPDDTSASVAEGIEQAGQMLEDAGYHVSAESPPRLAAAAKVATRISIWELGVRWDALRPMITGDARTHIELMFEVVGPVSAEDYLHAYADRLLISQEWAQFFERYPVVVGPVSTRPPFRVGADLNVTGVEEIINSMVALLAVNALGLPAAVVPIGRADDALPHAVQIIGARYQEHCCLDVAQDLEAMAPCCEPIDPYRVGP
jgi:amidase